jgi:hypothetical protein
MSAMYLTPDELAERWRLSKRTLEDWRAAKVGPVFMRFGRQVLYPLVEIERFEAESMVMTDRTVPA